MAVIKIDGRSEAKSVKLLGITFNNKFAFHDHATNIVNKMSSRIGQLKKIIPYADEKTSNMLATSLITSVASYGAEVYAKDKQVINRVQVKMNQAMRMITCSGNRTPINSMLKRLNWLKFDELIIYNKVMLFEKIAHVANASPFSRMLIVRGMMQVQVRYDVRERDLRIAWRPKTMKRGDRAFLVSAARSYNQMKVAGRGLDKDALKDHVKSTLVSWRKS